ncbi:MAG: hypothetical protein LBO80_08600 [Treponema sp.]|jgi:hypothetical protein|nr:hypothetical protein [Treponema sp.]
MNMIISSTDFLYEGVLFYRNIDTGRCYRLVEPSGVYGRAARKDLLVSKRVSLAYYNKCFAACRRVAGSAA